MLCYCIILLEMPVKLTSPLLQINILNYFNTIKMFEFLALFSLSLMLHTVTLY